MAQVVLSRVRNADDAAAAEPLLRDYVNWGRHALYRDHGIDLDDDAVEAIHSSFRDNWTNLFTTVGRFYLATTAGLPVGLGALKPIRDDVAELKRLYLDPSFRGRGVGRMIVTTLLEEARLIGYSTVRLDTMYFMTDARELYLKMGFVDTEPFPGEAAGIGVADHARYMARHISAGPT